MAAARPRTIGDLPCARCIRYLVALSVAYRRLGEVAD